MPPRLIEMSFPAPDRGPRCPARLHVLAAEAHAHAPVVAEEVADERLDRGDRAVETDVVEHDHEVRIVVRHRAVRSREAHHQLALVLNRPWSMPRSMRRRIGRKRRFAAARSCAAAAPDRTRGGTHAGPGRIAQCCGHRTPCAPGRRHPFGLRTPRSRGGRAPLRRPRRHRGHRRIGPQTRRRGAGRRTRGEREQKRHMWHPFFHRRTVYR